jgi:hypothetical protein
MQLEERPFKVIIIGSAAPREVDDESVSATARSNELSPLGPTPPPQATRFCLNEAAGFGR